MTNISKQNAVNNIYSDLYKQVRCASTANVTIATDLNAGDTIDGITLVAGDLVLLKNQTAGAENGIYVVSASPARWVNYNSDSAIRGSKVLVKEGTANVGTVFANTNTAAITMESTSITYQRAVRETILADKTITVKTAGGDFADPILAYNSLAAYEIASTATVTIEIDDGIYTNTSSWNMTHPNGDRIVVTGKNYYTKTINSIQSAGSRTQEGSTGAYYTDYVLNMNTVTNIAANDWVFIAETSLGTEPYLIQGCSQVQSVDSGNTRITVRVYSNSTTQSSGNVTTAKCYVIKTILQFNGCHGIYGEKAKIGDIRTLQIVGDRTAGKNGVYLNNGCTARLGDGGTATYYNSIGISKFIVGVQCLASYVIVDNCMSSSNSTYGFSADGFGSIVGTRAIVSDSTSGFVANGNSYAAFFRGVSFGCRTNGAYSISGSWMSVDTGYITRSGTYGIICDRYSGSKTNATVNNSGTTDIYSTGNSYQYCTGATYGSISPAANTVGNNNSYNQV